MNLSYEKIKELDDRSLRNLLALSVKELTERGIIRTKNILGELGEHDAVEIFNSNANLPNLKLAEKSQSHYDAIDVDNGDKYSIKSISRETTGVFTAMEVDENHVPKEKYFDYLLICKYEMFTLKEMYKVPWDVFVDLKKMHKTMGKYNINLTNKLKELSKCVYKEEAL